MFRIFIIIPWNPFQHVKRFSSIQMNRLFQKTVPKDIKDGIWRYKNLIIEWICYIRVLLLRLYFAQLKFNLGECREPRKGTECFSCNLQLPISENSYWITYKSNYQSLFSKIRGLICFYSHPQLQRFVQTAKCFFLECNSLYYWLISHLFEMRKTGKRRFNLLISAILYFTIKDLFKICNSFAIHHNSAGFFFSNSFSSFIVLDFLKKWFQI